MLMLISRPFTGLLLCRWPFARLCLHPAPWGPCYVNTLELGVWSSRCSPVQLLLVLRPGGSQLLLLRFVFLFIKWEVIMIFLYYSHLHICEKETRDVYKSASYVTDGCVKMGWPGSRAFKFSGSCLCLPRFLRGHPTNEPPCSLLLWWAGLTMKGS